MPRIELTRQLFGSLESGRLRVGGWYVSALILRRARSPFRLQKTKWRERVEVGIAARRHAPHEAMDFRQMRTIQPLERADVPRRGQGHIVCRRRPRQGRGGIDVEFQR